MFKFIRFALLLILLSPVTKSQIYDPVTWEIGYEKTGENRYEIVFTAFIEKGSHIYAMKIPEGGPIPTSFSIDTAQSFELDGTVYEVTKPVEKLDEAFSMNIGTHSLKAEFRQKIISDKPSFRITGILSYMACNNVTCSPPKDVEFSVNIGSGQQIPSETGILETGSKPASGSRGLLGFFLISLLAGFAGILTPCVFPMIPMTVAFFSRDAQDRGKPVLQALIFGFAIVFIYSFLGIIVSLTSAGAGFANTLSTHWIPNLLFFGLFVLFASSFFGAFEIVLPNRWVSEADSKVDKGGLLASFFLGLTTVIVSFSCTGPIIGVLLVEAAAGDVIRPTLGMFGFGLAFALPFTLFALFPSMLKRLPKSGAWLNSVKVVLGFIMLAFSLKFLSIIDSVYSFRIISRDIFLMIWIVIFSLTGLYLMGKIKFRHDNDLTHIGTFRLFLIIGVFSFVLYLLTGLFGAPLKGLSALLPPQGTSAFSKPVPVPESNISDNMIPGLSFSQNDNCSESRFADIFEMPYGLTGYFDYRQGLDCAREKGKPVLLDFKGHACANCKLMEARVWSDPGVLNRLREEFVIVSLYVDDRTQLPENEWVTSEVDGKVKRTIGKINEDLEIMKFKTNSIPLYVITDHDGNALVEPMPTNLDVSSYLRWLDEGIMAFRNQMKFQ